MLNLSFAVTGVKPAEQAAAPSLNFRLRVSESTGAAVHSLLLRAQIQLQPRRRKHSAKEQERLEDLFGEPSRWSETLRPLLWNQAVLLVPAFQGSTELDFPVACTYDLEVAGAKYLQALDEGEIPLLFLFSGTVFVKSSGGFSVEHVPWDREAPYRMPVEVWRQLMDAYFPGCAWLRLRRENLDALQRFKTQNGFWSLDEAIAALLDRREAAA